MSSSNIWLDKSCIKMWTCVWLAVEERGEYECSERKVIDVVLSFSFNDLDQWFPTGVPQHPMGDAKY